MKVLDESQLTSKMMQSAREVLGDINKDSLQQTEDRVRRIAGAISSIMEQYAAGRMMVNEGRLHLNIQKNVARCSLYNLQNIGVLLADAAIDAALGAVRDEVNREMGCELL